jgi:hypothetical protein
MKVYERCICCGEIVPEGKQLCGVCERVGGKFNVTGNPGTILTADDIRLALELSKRNNKLYRFMPGSINEW